MKYITLLFLIFLLFVPVLAAEEIILSELFNPKSLLVDDSNIYVVQQENVLIYSLEDFKLVKKFGKAGEGPKEFRKSPAPWFPSITIYFKDANLMVNSMGKISIYSKNGDFISENPTKGIVARFIPFTDNYIIMDITVEDKINYTVASMVDANLENKKQVCRVKFPQQDGKKRNPILMAKMTTLFDRFCHVDTFVLPAEEGAIKVFDKLGKETTSFVPQYTRVKVNSTKARELDEFFCNDARFKRPYLQDKTRNLITFGDYLPAFNYYRLDDNKIYIFSSFKKGDKYETFIYDLKGKLLKKTFVPLVDQDLFNVFPFTIKKGKIYQLFESGDEEEIKLRITKIS